MAEVVDASWFHCHRSDIFFMLHGSAFVTPPRGNRWSSVRRCRPTSCMRSRVPQALIDRLPTPTRWSTLASSETISESTAAARTLLFRVAGKMYGCDIDAVREIIPYRRATRLPGAPSFVQGLINLRGTIVTVLDLGARLDPDRPPIRDGSIILATHGTRVVGVAVDEVMDVQAITEEHVEAHGGARDALIRGLGHSESDVVVLVDIHTLVTQVLL